MIPLSPTTALMVYLGITLATILTIWLSHHSRSRRRKPLSSPKKLYICEYCHFAYLDETAKPVTRCPQCNLYNSLR